MKDYVLNRPNLIVHQPKSQEDWLLLRRCFIGGSDIAAILNRSPWGTPFTVWCEKMGVSAKKDTPAMEAGRRAEKEILDRAKNMIIGHAREEIDSIEVFTSPATYINGNMGASLDGIAVINGREIGIEIKTTSHRVKWTSVPDQYMYQVQHYMHVCDLDSFVIIAISENWQGVYWVERDKEIGAEIEESCRIFWDFFVDEKSHPDLCEGKRSIENDYMIAAARAGIFDLCLNEDDIVNACNDYQAKKEQVSELQKDLDSLRTKIIVSLKSENECSVPGYKIGLNVIEKSTFDLEKFKRHYPELYSSYLKESSYTQLVVRGL